MEPKEPNHTMTATEARSGQKTGMVRRVLGISLVLVVVGFLVAWFATRI